MSTIKDTVITALGFHGRQIDPVIESVVEALEWREARVQADLLRVALDAGLDEDIALDAIHDIYAHADHTEAEEPTFDAVLAQVMSLSRLLSEHTTLLATVASSSVH